MTDKVKNLSMNTSLANLSVDAKQLLDDALDTTLGSSNTDKLLLAYALASHLTSVAKKHNEKAKKAMLAGVNCEELDKLKKQVKDDQIGDNSVVYRTTAYQLHAKVNKPVAKVALDAVRNALGDKVSDKAWADAVKAATSLNAPATTLEVQMR